MKWLLLIFLFSFNARAVDVNVFGGDGELLFGISINTHLPANVSDITQIFLDEAKAKNLITAYDFNGKGLASVNELGSDIKVAGPNEFEYFGWCFKLNGFDVTEPPTETMVLSQTSRITWFYAFSVLKQNEWVKSCVPASQSKTRHPIVTPINNYL